MRRALLFPILLAAIPAWPYASDKEDTQVVNATLEPGKVLEVCSRMDAGQKRRYNWKSSGPVDFNVHYHEGPEVFYPVKRDAMRGDGGTFTAKIPQDYCWMWTAKAASVKIDGRIEAPR